MTVLETFREESKYIYDYVIMQIMVIPGAEGVGSKSPPEHIQEIEKVERGECEKIKDTSSNVPARHQAIVKRLNTEYKSVPCMICYYFDYKTSNGSPRSKFIAVNWWVS